MSWESSENTREDLKSQIGEWVRDTGTSLILIATITVICLILIGTIALVVNVIELAVSSSLINLVKVVAIVAIAIVYLITIGYSLYKYVTDLLRMSQRRMSQRGSRS